MLALTQLSAFKQLSGMDTVIGIHTVLSTDSFISIGAVISSDEVIRIDTIIRVGKLWLANILSCLPVVFLGKTSSSFALKKALNALCHSYVSFGPVHPTLAQHNFRTGLIFPVQSLFTWPDCCLFQGAPPGDRIGSLLATFHQL